MGKIRTVNQRKLTLFAKRFNEKGYQTWRVFTPRAETVEVVWMACNMLNPDDPYVAYESVKKSRGAGAGVHRLLFCHLMISCNNPRPYFMFFTSFALLRSDEA